MVKAAFFDLDGTLQDSEVIWVAATHEYLHDQGADISYDEAQAIVYGRGWGEVYKSMVKLVPALAPLGSQVIACALREYFLRLRSTANVALPGSIATLRKLAATMPVAIVSGSTRHDIAEAIDHLGVGDVVQFYIGAEDYNAGKPNPECFLMAARHLDIPPAECVVFEDSSVGVQAAKRASMYCVALARPGSPSQNLDGADLVLSDLGDFRMEDLTGNDET